MPKKMFIPFTRCLALLAVASMIACSPPEAVVEVVEPVASDPLASWTDGPAKSAIIEFVQVVTNETGSGYVPPEDRIATFDNDGTLWPSHPMYAQLAFAVDRVKALAPQHPEWQTQQPFKAVLDNDLEALAAAGEHGLLELVLASHAGVPRVSAGQRFQNLYCFRWWC